MRLGGGERERERKRERERERERAREEERERERERGRARLQPVEEKQAACLSAWHEVYRRTTESLVIEITQNNPKEKPGGGKNNRAGREGEGGRKKDDATEKCCRHSLFFCPSTLSLLSPLSSPPTAFRSPRISQVPLTNVRSARSHALYIRPQTSYSHERFKIFRYSHPVMTNL